MVKEGGESVGSYLGLESFRDASAPGADAITCICKKTYSVSRPA